MKGYFPQKGYDYQSDLSQTSPMKDFALLSNLNICNIIKVTVTQKYACQSIQKVTSN